MSTPVPTLLPFQKDTIARLTEQPRAILGSEMGLGKTLCAIEAIKQQYPVNTSVLVACGLRRTVYVWRDELEKWCPDVPVLLYRGTIDQRRKLLSSITTFTGYVITTVAMLKEIYGAREHWPVIAIDEAHLLRNRRTQWFRNLKKFRSDNFYWITGSPQVNTPADLWTAFHLIEPKHFRSYWKFVDQHCLVENNGFGQKIIGTRNPAWSRQELGKYIIRYKKEEVQHQLPKKWRRSRPVELTSEQARIYQELEKDFIASVPNASDPDLPPNVVITPTVLAKLTRLRQLLITPALLGGENDSGALNALLDYLDESPEPTVVFTPFAKALPFLSEPIRKHGFYTEELHGGLSDNEFEKRKSDFRKHAHPRKVLLSTIRSAASWETPEASVGYFVGWDWTPAYNAQAEDRLHRLTSIKPVFIWYLFYSTEIEDNARSLLDRKTWWSYQLLDPPVAPEVSLFPSS